MGNYLHEFLKNPSFNEIEKLLPSGICPFLFYNLTPYIFTISNGGWFDWVIRQKDDAYRRSINEKDFQKHTVNRLYPNEVLVRCPNPNFNVVAGVGLWPEGKVKIRLLNSNKNCPSHHQTGDDFIIDRNEYKKKSLDYSIAFFKVLYSVKAGKTYKADKNCCDISDDLIVEVSKIIFPCRYHKGKKIFKEKFLPDGFCLHVFGYIYPQVLALMYNADIDNEININHPDTDENITLFLNKKYFTENLFLKALKDLLIKLYAIIFYPIDLIDYELEIIVLENGFDQCPIKKGKRYYVNMRSNLFLCPASFHSLYPYLILLSKGYNFNWNGSEKNIFVPCPDCVGSIYSLKKDRREF